MHASQDLDSDGEDDGFDQFVDGLGAQGAEFWQSLTLNVPAVEVHLNDVRLRPARTLHHAGNGVGE